MEAPNNNQSTGGAPTNPFNTTAATGPNPVAPAPTPPAGSAPIAMPSVPPKKSNTGLIIGIVAGGVLVVGAIVTLLLVLLMGDDKSDTNTDNNNSNSSNNSSNNSNNSNSNNNNSNNNSTNNNNSNNSNNNSNNNNNNSSGGGGEVDTIAEYASAISNRTALNCELTYQGSTVTIQANDGWSRAKVQSGGNTVLAVRGDGTYVWGSSTTATKIAYDESIFDSFPSFTQAEIDAMEDATGAAGYELDCSPFDSRDVEVPSDIEFLDATSLGNG